MTPNQSHVAGLELALDATGPFTSAAGARQKMRDILEQAKSAPAEVAQGADKPKAIGYINKKDLARLQDEITWDGTYLHIGVDHFAQWLEDTPYEHLAPIYAAPPSPDADLVELLRDAAEVIRDSDSGWYLLKRIEAKLATLTK
jgi:hypothetical protein